jgi:CO/xanthine dehydrogenase FAD-binding subunit
MLTRPFDYQAVDHLEEACDLLRHHGEAARVVAGGQSLLPLVNLGLAQPSVVVDISRASGHRAIEVADGSVRIGALLTHARLAADPLLSRSQPLLGAAAARIGNARVRVRGTLGGSLAHSDPAAELPLVMVALGATYELVDPSSTREVKAEEFHAGFLSTVLEPDELVASAVVPALGPGWGWGFQEVSRREGDFALVAIAAVVRLAGGRIAEARIAAGGVADRPLRLAEIEVAVAGLEPAELEDRLRSLLPLPRLAPPSDTNATGTHRAHLAGVLVRRAVGEAAARAEEARA